MGETMHNSSDILVTGEGIEVRSVGVLMLSGCVVLGWLSGVSVVREMSVLMFKWWRLKWSSDEWVKVRMGYESIIDLCWREYSCPIAGHLRYIFSGCTVRWQGEKSEWSMSESECQGEKTDEVPVKSSWRSHLAIIVRRLSLNDDWM